MSPDELAWIVIVAMLCTAAVLINADPETLRLLMVGAK